MKQIVYSSVAKVLVYLIDCWLMMDVSIHTDDDIPVRSDDDRIPVKGSQRKEEESRKRLVYWYVV